jgi:hypothetical protein
MLAAFLSPHGGEAVQLLCAEHADRSGRSQPWRTTIFALVSITLCTGFAVAQSLNSDAQGSDTIQGSVVNSVTREPVGHALVSTDGDTLATFTDDHGKFELRLPSTPQGVGMAGATVSISVRKPGYVSPSYERRPGPVARWVITHWGDNSVTVPLTPEAFIVGRVKFPSPDAGDHLSINLYRKEVRDGSAKWERATTVRTRSDGEFRFAELPAGEYRLFTGEETERDPIANSPNGPVLGFPPHFFASARDFASANVISLQAGQTVTANIAIQRQKYFDVRVPVRFPEGAETGVSVEVFAQGRRGPGFALGYSQELHSIVGSLPNGVYTIEASSFRPVAATGVTQIAVNDAAATGAPLTMSPNPSVEVSIRDEPGTNDTRYPQPPPPDLNQPGVQVILHPADEFSRTRGPMFVAQGTPPAIAGVKPGLYWVQAAANGGYIASITSGGRDLFGTPLVVTSGGAASPIDITVRHDTGEIEATIEGQQEPARAAGPPQAPGVPVTVRMGSSEMPQVYCISVHNDGRMPIEAHGSVNGHPSFYNVPPGDYRVIAFKTRQEMEYHDPAAMRKYESLGQAVHVDAGKKTQVKLQVVTAE